MEKFISLFCMNLGIALGICIGHYTISEFDVNSQFLWAFMGLIFGVKLKVLVRGFFYYWHLPTCKNERCKHEDYTLKSVHSDGCLYVCGCGTLYLFKKRRLFILDKSDNSLKPYMVKKFMQPWRLDESVTKKNIE